MTHQPTPPGTPSGGRPPWSASPEEVDAFVARHGTPYARTNDHYRDPGAFTQAVAAGKNSAIYRAHSYHTKVPHEGIVQYLEHYTNPGDLVLDPFCGSGMTGVAAIKSGRNSVLNDLSPAATHIAYNYCTQVDMEAVGREWQRIKAVVAEEFRWLYGTICNRCNGPATIQHTVWSDVFQCPHCEGEIVLWDTAVVREESAHGFDPPLSQDARPGQNWQVATPKTAAPKRDRGGADVPRNKGDVLDRFPCPQCSQTWQKRQLNQLRREPVLTTASCPQCRPNRQGYPTTLQEKAKIQEIEQRDIPYWFPSFALDQTREMYIRCALRKRGITNVHQFWTKRNLWALARLWDEFTKVRDLRLRRALIFGFTGMATRLSLLSRLRPSGSGDPLSGTLYIGSLTRDDNVENSIGRKLDDIKKGLQTLLEVNPTAHGYTSSIVTQHAGQQLPLADQSVDYIFTDPPFGANIFYSDVNLLWEAWLGHLTDEAYDAVWNKSKKPAQGGKTIEDYKRLMREAFGEMRRVLKPGRWASVVFHNSDDKVWDAIREGAEEAGFTIENAQAFDKQQKTFKGIRGDKGLERVSNLDIVLNLRKPHLGQGTFPGLDQAADDFEPPTGPTPNGEGASVREAVAGRVEAYLTELAARGAHAPKETGSGQDPRGVQAVHSNVIQLLINADYPTTGISYAQVQIVLEEFFKEVDGRWYRLGDQVGSASGESSADMADQLNWTRTLVGPTDETSAIDWIRASIQAKGPQLEGELTGQLRMAAPNLKLRKELRQLLEENFSYDKRRGRWRNPTATESEAKLSVKVNLLERRVQELVRRDTSSPGPDGIGQLIDDCYRDGLSQQVVELYQMLSPGDLQPERERELAAKARVCRAKAATMSSGG